jgi:hypothetical protein
MGLKISVCIHHTEGMLSISRKQDRNRGRKIPYDTTIEDKILQQGPTGPLSPAPTTALALSASPARFLME